MVDAEEEGWACRAEALMCSACGGSFEEVEWLHQRASWWLHWALLKEP